MGKFPRSNVNLCFKSLMASFLDTQTLGRRYFFQFKGKNPLGESQCPVIKKRRVIWEEKLVCFYRDTHTQHLFCCGFELDHEHGYTWENPIDVQGKIFSSGVPLFFVTALKLIPAWITIKNNEVKVFLLLQHGFYCIFLNIYDKVIIV